MENYKLEYKKKNVPELVACAINDEAMIVAVQAGCDAICGRCDINKNSVKILSSSFDNAEILIKYIHKHGRKFYLDIPYLIKDDQIPKIYETLEWAEANMADAVIVNDIGLLHIIKLDFPELTIHAGKLFNIHNINGLKQLETLGVKRAALSHELSYDEIDFIAGNISGIEIELPIHGESCIDSYMSCFWDNYKHKENPTECSNRCRKQWNYNGESGFFLSTYSLNAIDYIKPLSKLGIRALSIIGYFTENGHIYSAASVYRMILDSIDTPSYRLIASEAKKILDSSPSRVNSCGYLNGRLSDQVEKDRSGIFGKYIGIAKHFMHLKLTVSKESKAKIKKGDTIISFDPLKQSYHKITVMSDEFNVTEDKKNCDIVVNKSIPSGNWIYLYSTSGWDNSSIAAKLQIIYSIGAIKQKDKIESSSERIQKHAFKSEQFIFSPNHFGNSKGTGIQVKFDNPEWDFLLDDQDINDFIFELNYDKLQILDKLIKKWKKYNSRIIIEFPPLIFDKYALQYHQAARRLAKNNFNRFMINNISHMELIKGINAELTAGQQLFCFNRLSAWFLDSMGFKIAAYPVFGDMVNLKKMLFSNISEFISLSIFFHPVFLYSRANLSEKIPYGSIIKGDDGESVYIQSKNDTTIVSSTTPYSLSHMLGKLENLQIGNYMVDLSFIKPSEEYWKKIIGSILYYNATPDAISYNFNISPPAQM